MNRLRVMLIVEVLVTKAGINVIAQEDLVLIQASKQEFNNEMFIRILNKRISYCNVPGR